MNGTHNQHKRIGGRRAIALLIVFGLAAAFGAAGCDEYADYGYDYGYYDYSGYGPIDDDVFDAAADAWSDYIRM